jgi:Immunoglobulin domain
VACLLSALLFAACGSDVKPVTSPVTPPATDAPEITTQPADQAVAAGQTATFSVAATGTAPLSYQWEKDGAAISGATGSSYTTPAATSADNGSVFSAVVTNAAGSVTSGNATLTVTVSTSAPQITAQPANQSVVAGQTATFTVVATGTAPLTYQWRKNGVAISGATGVSYTTPATASADNGSSYSVVVSNSGGSVTSTTATLTVTTTAPPTNAPQITAQPASQTVSDGQTATFSVVATGTAPLTYQWRKNGAAISGATGASYTTPVTATSDTGSAFSVVVSNIAGNVTSANATLTVNAAPQAPQIMTQPASQTVTAGQTATFTVVASGTAPLTYQWSKGGTAIPGATGASYTTPATTSADNGSPFAVVVSNTAGNVTSNSAVLTVTTASSGTDVVTYKNDVLRTGQNINETTLTPTNVKSTTFGLLRNLSVDGKVDAQPLYLSHLTIGGASHNVVFVATENDSVYAFDTASGAALWHVSLVGSGETPSDNVGGCNQVTPTIGVTSTPVIDRSAGAHGTIYVVGMTKDSSSNYHHRLHALDVVTGAEQSGGPTEITATYGSTSFSPQQYEERAALLLTQGTIYTSWTSHCDNGPYGGWIIAFNASTLARSGVLNVGPGASGTGYDAQGPAFWMAGGGPAADSSGNVYLLTANGPFETTLDGNGFPSGGDYGNSFLKISSSGGNLAVTDYFTMSNEQAESVNDTDLGSGGVMLLPDVTDASGIVRHLVLGAGKDANMYVVNRDSMGKFNSTSNNIWQELDASLCCGVFSTPAYFNGTVYYGPQQGTLRAFSVINAMVSGSPTSQTSLTFGYPGTSPVVSANGTANAIVWAYDNSSPAILHAYDATNLATELYNSNQASGARDQFGAGNKFITPTVADGMVFVASTNSVAVFGLLP